MLFGATGYTGRLVAHALVRARARPVLAGRSHQSLAALGVTLGKGLDIAVADVSRPELLLEIIQRDDVLISTVGPFARYGRPVVEAAIHRRATYVDSSGEPAFLRVVFEELGPVAAAGGVTLIPSCAYDFVAGNLAGALALHGLPDAGRVDVGYFLRGSYRGAVSMGTRKSVGGLLLAPHFAWRDAALLTVPAGERTRTFAIDGHDRPALSFGSSEHLTLPRLHQSLREVNTYLGLFRRPLATRLTGRALGRAVKIPGAARAATWVTQLPVGREGPDPAQRERRGCVVVAVAYQGERELRTVRLEGANPYTFSGDILAWAALRLSHGGPDATGALGPVEAFGLEPLRDACAAAGLAVSEG